MGPRIGRFDKKGRPVPMPGHSVPLSALGGLILIFGFFACNGTKQVSNCYSSLKTSYFIRYLWNGAAGEDLGAVLKPKLDPKLDA